MKIILIIVIGLLAVASFGPSVGAAPTAKVTVQVVDENSMPISGAEVEVWYVRSKAGGPGTDDIKIDGKTDKDGFFTAKGETFLPQVTVYARSIGYYESVHLEKFTGRSLLLRWEPWNPTVDVMLRKKRNHVPMYTKRTDWLKVPKLGELVGYDLERGDWVAPYGKGVVRDLVINYQVNMRSNRDYDCKLEITFTNEKDGIQEFFFDEQEQSSYKWPFIAPVNGYIDKLSKEIYTASRQLVSNVKDEVNYLFRVRTKIDKDGNIVAARYGKIFGDFEISQSGKINFTYYFNPDGTRNLEFDPEKNLFKWARKQRNHMVKKP